MPPYWISRLWLIRRIRPICQPHGCVFSKLEPHFHHMKPRSEVSGMGEGLEGPQLFLRGVVGAPFHFEQPRAGDVRDEAALRLEAHDLTTDCIEILGEAREIDMRGDVDLARCIERILAGAVL